jgi:hypothetical protein
MVTDELKRSMLDVVSARSGGSGRLASQCPPRDLEGLRRSAAPEITAGDSL